MSDRILMPVASFLGMVGSSGHRANILDSRFYKIGVGVAASWQTEYGDRSELFWATQNFSLCR